VVLLAGEGLILREHTLDDLRPVLKYAADPVVARYVTWEPATEQTALAFLKDAVTTAAQTPRSSYVLAIVERASRGVIGAARIGIEAGADRRADIGYVLRRDRWHRGWATKAAGMLVDFGFRDLGMYRIWATSHPENLASARVLERIGMTYEGRIRGHMFVKGAWRDSLAYAIVRPDWAHETYT
jgi:RimJ/RimL family protein N-acetyltransferase